MAPNQYEAWTRASSSATSRTGTRGRNRGEQRKFRSRTLLQYCDAACRAQLWGSYTSYANNRRPSRTDSYSPSRLKLQFTPPARYSRPSVKARVRLGIRLTFRIPNRSGYARPRPQYQPPPPSKNTTSTTIRIVSTLILKSSKRQSGRSTRGPSVQ